MYLEFHSLKPGSDFGGLISRRPIESPLIHLNDGFGAELARTFPGSFAVKEHNTIHHFFCRGLLDFLDWGCRNRASNEARLRNESDRVRCRSGRAGVVGGTPAHRPLLVSIVTARGGGDLADPALAYAEFF